MRWVWGLLLLLPGCKGPAAFSCADDSQCILGGSLGVCESTGYCSFPDTECTSGKKYGGHAGAGLGGSCVPPGDTSGGTTTTATTGSGTTDDTLDPTSATPTTNGSTGLATATDGTSGTTTGVAGTGSTGPGSTGSTGPVCGDLGDACTVAADCCNGCMDCVGNVCVARTGDPTPCAAECMACSALAECTIAEGQACGNESIDCSEKVWGVSGSACYALKNNVVGSSCNALGQCVSPDFADCPNEQGDELVACSLACFKNPNNCNPGVNASSILPSSVCYVNQTTPGCDLACSNGSGSSLTQRSCTSSGQCGFVQTLETCDPYYCENNACNTSCVDSSDCSFFAYCDTMTNMCGY